MIRGIITSVIEGMIKILNCIGRSGETFENREYIQHYGFTSRPLSGAEIIIINEGNHYIGIASDDRRYRLAVENGEVALYTDEGDKIHLKRDKTIEIVSGNKLVATVENEVEITTKTARINASIACEVTSSAVTINSASILLGGDQGTMRQLIDERIIAIFNAHTHGGSPAPSEQLTLANVGTNIVKGA